MEIAFDFKEVASHLFGTITRPVAEVIFIYNGTEISETVFVDSGADVTLIPKSLGEVLGFTIDKTDTINELYGIGEQGIPIVLKQLKIKVGDRLCDIRVAWALIEEVPLLLGRTDIFPRFNVCFKKNTTTVFTDELLF